VESAAGHYCVVKRRKQSVSSVMINPKLHPTSIKQKNKNVTFNRSDVYVKMGFKLSASAPLGQEKRAGREGVVVSACTVS